MKTMITQYSQMLLVLLGSILLASCGSTADVVSSSFIQKRKYAKGYHFQAISKKKKVRDKVVMAAVPSSVILLERQSESVFDKDSMVVFSSYGITSGNESNSNDSHRKAGKEFQKHDKFKPALNQATSSLPRAKDRSVNDLRKKIKDTRIVPSEAELGLAIAFIGIFLPILGAIISIATCCNALSKINKNPDKYRGRGWAIAGIVLAVLQIFFFFLLLSALANMNLSMSFSC